MDISEIVSFWRGQQMPDENGRWMHRLDRQALTANPHSFNLDHPVSPFVGKVLSAPVLILGANAGYSETLTPTEFTDEAAELAYVQRVDSPELAD